MRTQRSSSRGNAGNLNSGSSLRGGDVGSRGTRTDKRAPDEDLSTPHHQRQQHHHQVISGARQMQERGISSGPEEGGLASGGTGLVERSDVERRFEGTINFNR